MTARPWPLCRARSVARRKPRSWPVLRLTEPRRPSTTRSDGPLRRGTNRSGLKRVLREGARADPPAVGSLPRRVVGRDRQEAPTLAPDQRALIERADDLRRLGVDQAGRVKLLVRVVPVPPAVGEPLAEPGPRHLPAEIALEGAAGAPRAGESGNQFHAQAGSLWARVAGHQVHLLPARPKVVSEPSAPRRDLRVGDQVVEEVGAADRVVVVVGCRAQLILDLAPNVTALLLNHAGRRAGVVQVEINLGAGGDSGGDRAT